MHSTTPIPVKGCNVHRTNVSLYLAFVCSTLPIPVKGCKLRRILCHFTSRSCVRPWHANPCEGLQSAPHNVSLYLAFVLSTLPIPVKGLQVAPHTLSLYLAFVRSTTRIPVKGCLVRMAMCHFTSRSCAPTTRIPVKGCIPDRWGWRHPGYK